MKNMDRTFMSRGYVLQDVLGEGAFAQVLLCKNIKDKKLYAAKVMNFEGNRRLKWEAENEIEVGMTIFHIKFSQEQVHFV